MGREKEGSLEQERSFLNFTLFGNAQYRSLKEGAVILSLFLLRAGPCSRFDLFLAQRYHCHMVAKL